MKKLLLTIVFLSSTVVAHADFDMLRWQYQKAIVLPTRGSDYVKVPLDNEILAGSQRGQGDLRVIDSSSTEVNYQLVKNDGSVTRGEYPATMLNLVDNATAPSFILDLGKSGVVSSGIKITALYEDSYKRQVSVSGADTLSSTWQNLTSAGYVYSYYDKRANFHTADGNVSYPSATFRYLKVTVAPGEGSITVSGAMVLRADKTPAVTSLLTPTFVSSENKTDRTTELTFDLGQSGIATSKLTLGLVKRGEQFSRSATVSTSNDNVRWATIGNGYLFNLQTPKFTGANLELSYPETRERYMRVTVMNEDNQPVAFSGAAVEVTESDIIFKANASTSYILYYGNASARTPQYELSRYFQYLDTTDMPVGSFGPEVPNATYVPILPPFSERHPSVLNSILVLMVIVAFGIIVLYMQKLKQVKPR